MPTMKLERSRNWKSTSVLLLTCCTILLAACNGSSVAEVPRAAAAAPANVATQRDVDELQRIKRTPRSCDAHADCPAGSRCDDESDQCRWDCIADSDCGEGRACTALGACTESAPAFSLYMSADSDGCQAVPADERRAALVGLNDEQRICSDELGCPCGSYCASDATCRVECLADEPDHDVLVCDPGEVCSPVGRCAASAADPGPQIEVTLELEPTLLTANNALGAVVVEADITMIATSLEVLEPAHPATVFVGFAERHDPVQGPMPRVKCSPTGALAPSCEIAGGWLFDLSSGSLRSTPRRVWVEVPAGADASWTLEARSEWADLAAVALVDAAPRVVPATDAGRYTGKITWPQAGGSPLELAVEAIVTPSHVAIYEKTRVLLPNGHVVLSRDQNLATMLGWLRSDVTSGTPSRLDVKLDLGSLAYNSQTGVLSGVISLITRSYAEPLALEIDRAGDNTAPQCPGSGVCAAGSYCNSSMGLCLPGSGPPEGGGIVSDASPASVPSSTLRSAQVEAWAPPLANIVAGNPAHLGGTGIPGVERAYCYRSPSQAAAGSFGYTTVEPSLDLACADGAAQPTFGYVNRTKEVTVDQQGAETFNLLDKCLEDLSVQPTGPASPANLLPVKPCVSLGRFFLALNVHVMLGGVGQSPPAAAQTVLTQILRQWLGVNAYAARTVVQEQGYDDVLGSGGAPVHERFGLAVDLMERGWRVLLDPSVRPQFTAGPDWYGTAGAPDYRFVSRPVARWNFNAPLGGIAQDAESDFDLSMSGVFAQPNEKQVMVNSATDGVCQTTQPVALSDQHFTLVGYVAAAVDGTFKLFEKQSPNGERLWIDIYWNKTGAPKWIWVHVKDSANRRVSFNIPQAAGYYAYVSEGNTARLYRLGTVIEEFYPDVIAIGTPHWGAAGTVRLACDVPNQLVVYDEVSIWNRPLAKETLFAMSKLYNNAAGLPVAANQSMPPRAITASPADEQAAGLALHMLETANANLELLSSYLEAERGVMYEECYLGAASPARERALSRAGRGLRMVSLMEAEAAVLTAVAGASDAAWFDRYQANQVQLAGQRAKVLDALVQTGSCTNPLGVSEDDLPLFHGSAVGSSDRFFASSRYLASQARNEIAAAENELLQARSAYQQQRQSAFQVTMSVVDKIERMRRLRLEYEGRLRRYCGSPAGGGLLLPSFLNGTLTSANCYFKTEVPSCSGLENTPVRSVPSTCLRGELGERILSIQAAAIDSDNADNNYNRAIDQYDSEMDYCARRQAHHDESDTILLEHHEHMEKLREEKRSAGMFGSFVKGMVGMAVGGLTSNPAIAIGAWLDVVGVVAGQAEADVAEDEQEAEEQHQRVMEARSHELDLMSCYHGADNQKFAIDASRDVIKRAYHDVMAAMFALENAKNELTSLVDEAAGEIAVEETIDRTPPHHHFWLDDHIDAYRRHLRYARRLTYLTLRSFEYESQQQIGYRGQVLTARRPDHLLQVVEAIEQRNAPMQGEQGYVIGETPIVLSLRDEILRLENLAANTNRAPGDPAITAEEAFRRYLLSPSSKMYDANGVLLGRGIRFSIRPAGWSETSCAERTWRVTTSLQMLGTLNNARMTLLQENAFASQQCRSAQRGKLRMARIRPFHNLLVGESEGGFEPPSRHTAMNVDGLWNRTRTDMEMMVEGRHEGFAGRGLYGNYILLFPPIQFTDSVLAGLKDVLIRFDIVEVTNVAL